ncbi:hypothetical protein GCM10010399_44350 [Dactylosporangium fulvum]|uniref:Small CPxCG-related zinc finger protein n=1 Tax=Dactylosporangium fulvum TaxID=53359 RepID=A0ABY5W727_9ACTN|nr:hypothetical protein [Dactylosporangium fulvum]UWP85897.1 hypothetical protein Dfulv_17260 [Dactylosporangium fulvum]
MTALIHRPDGTADADCCPAGNHARDELCALVPLGSLPPLDQPEGEWVECPDCQGDEGWMDHVADAWVNCPNCDGSGGWVK